MLNAFRSSGKKKGGNIFIWILLGLIIIGLTGFGLGGAVSGLASQNVARVGDEPVERETFVRAMFRQLDAYTRTTQQSLTMSQAQSLGIDQQVLSQLVTVAAVDGEAKAMKLSVDDRIVGDRLLNSPGFQGLSGNFDQQAYDFFLNRQGLSAKEYEEELRAEAARALLQSSLAGGTDMPDQMSQTILGFLGEQRAFAYVVITPDKLPGDTPEPSETALRAYYDENPDPYTIPETRRVTYVALRPADLVDQVDVSQEDIQAAYDDRAEAYNTPENRLIDQISFLQQTDAQAAKDRIDAGEASFDDVAAERGLSEADISRGLVRRESLTTAAREAVYGAEALGVVGPVETDLGPSLFRINAIIPARSTPLEDVEDELRTELALDRARRQVGDHIDQVQDLLASGATLQEIADETDLSLGEVGISALPGEDLAADQSFRNEALSAEVDEDRDLIDLDDGGIAALRVTGIDAPALQPFEDVRAQVESDWAADEEQKRLVALAEDVQAQLQEGRTFSGVAGEAGLDLVEELPRDRSAVLASGIPPTLLRDVFDLDRAGATTVIADALGVYLVQLTDIVPVDPTDPDQAERLAQLDRAFSSQLGTDLFLGYAQLLTDTAGVEVNQQLIQNTLAQYP